MGKGYLFISVEETLKHIGTYWDIYRYLGREERSFDEIKKYLMNECEKPESTARANISGFKTARDNIIKISQDGKSVSVDPQKWNNLFWTMDKRMHFTDYDDRAKELKEVFDAYYEGVEKNADLSQEVDELEEELSKEQRKRQLDAEEWETRNEALQDKIKDCELKNCYQQIYYMNRLLNPPKVEVQEAFIPNRYEYECDVYEYIRRNHNAPDADITRA